MTALSVRGICRLAVDVMIDCLTNPRKGCAESSLEIIKSSCGHAVNRNVHPRPLRRQAHPLQSHVEAAVGSSIDSRCHLEPAINVITFVGHGYPHIDSGEILA